MNILFLGYKDCKLFDFLNGLYNVTHTEEKIRTESCEDFDWVISFGYRHILKSDFISRFDGKIINLHISYLPYNRGCHPNVWSFVEGTPKGVTIHLMDEGIDTGDILLQKIIDFSYFENTLSSTYKKLIEEIQNLFIENSDDLLHNRINAIPQSGEYSHHFAKDLKKIKHLLVDSWETKINLIMNNRTDLEIISDVEKVRAKNNVNWMDILRLAFTHAPKEAKALMSKVNDHDAKISDLLAELSTNEEA